MLRQPARCRVQKRLVAAPVGFSDDFNRADSPVAGSTMSSGATWGTLSVRAGNAASPRIVSGQVRNSGVYSNGGSAVVPIDPGTTNYTVSCKAVNGDQTSYIFARMDESASNFVYWRFNGMYLVTNGGTETLKVTHNVAANEVLGIACSGSTITALINGTAIGSFTSSAIPGTRTGLYIYDFINPPYSDAIILDNFAVTVP